MGSDRENPGAPTPMGQMGAPGSGCRTKTLAWEASDMLQCRFLSHSDHQNSVKSLPKVREMAFQRL
jgi:hypothetical protein